jgi:uncharacterized protein YecT (DUF1311 family)
MTILLFFALMAAEPEPDCKEPVTQLDMNRCSYLDYQAADAELNRVWGDVSAVMKKWDKDMNGTYRDGRAGYFTVLLESQRAWLKYRDQQCTLAGYEVRGGSMEPLVVNTCRATMTEARTKELQQLTEQR